MDISKKLEEKQKELQLKVEQFNQFQRNMNQLKQEIIKLQGAIEQLKELDEED